MQEISSKTFFSLYVFLGLAGLAGKLACACSSTLPIIENVVCLWLKLMFRILSGTTVADHSQSKQCSRYLWCISKTKSQPGRNIHTFFLLFLLNRIGIKLYVKGDLFRPESAQELHREYERILKTTLIVFHFLKPTKRKWFDCGTSRWREKRGWNHNVSKPGKLG